MVSSGADDGRRGMNPLQLCRCGVADDNISSSDNCDHFSAKTRVPAGQPPGKTADGEAANLPVAAGEDEELEKEVRTERARKNEGMYQKWKRFVIAADNERAGVQASALLGVSGAAADSMAAGEFSTGEACELPTYSLLSWRVFKILGEIGMGGPQYFMTLLAAGVLLLVYAIIEIPSMYFNYTGDKFSAGGNWFFIARFSLGHSSGFNSVYFPLVIVSFVKLAVYLLWLVVVRLLHAYTAYHTDKSNVTASDFASVISGLSEEEVLDLAPLREWLGQFGELHDVLPIYRTKKLQAAQRTIDQCNRDIKKVDLLVSVEDHEREGRAPGLTQDTSDAKEREALIARRGRLVSARDAAAEKLRTIENDLAARSCHLTTGHVFVTYRYEAGSRSLLNNQRSVSVREWLYHKMRHLTPPPREKFRGRHLSVRRADEPPSVYYDNYEIGRAGRFWRVSVMWSLVLLMMLVHFALSITLSVFKLQISTGLTFIGIEIRRYFNTVQAVIILVTNWTIRKVFISMHGIEGHTSATGSEQSLIAAVTLSQVINAAVVPIVVEYDPDQWYTEGGLAEQAWAVVLWNNVLAAPSHYLQSFYRLRRYGLSWFVVHDDTKLAAMVRCPEWFWSERYAIGLKGFYLALLFGTLNPMSYLVAVLGVILNFLMDYYLFVKVYRTPRIVSDKVSSSVRSLFKLAFVAKVVYSNYFYIMQSRNDVDSDSGIVVLTYTSVSLVAMIIVVLFPTEWFKPRLFVKKLDVAEGDQSVGQLGLATYRVSAEREEAGRIILGVVSRRRAQSGGSLPPVIEMETLKAMTGMV